MPYALCPMPYAPCPMPHALCPMPQVRGWCWFILRLRRRSRPRRNRLLLRLLLGR
jgi:hypothetical protein